MTLDLKSKDWCDATYHAGYLLQKEPTLGSKIGTRYYSDETILYETFFKGLNDTEHEECLAYNFGGNNTNFLCLSDDYCSEKYPFICEMNAASIALASSTHHGLVTKVSKRTIHKSLVLI